MKVSIINVSLISTSLLHPNQPIVNPMVNINNPMHRHPISILLLSSSSQPQHHNPLSNKIVSHPNISYSA